MTTPYYENYFDSVVKLPKKKHFFITIRDPTQNSKWCTIGKVNDWIRRYATNYIIVRGLKGGIHFHLIAYCDKGEPRGVKGIRFHMDILISKVDVKYCPDSIDGKLQSIYISEQRKITAIERMAIPIQCLEISDMIKSHWRRIQSREKRADVKDVYGKRLWRVLNYLQKNLEENRSIEQIQYLSWIQK